SCGSGAWWRRDRDGWHKANRGGAPFGGDRRGVGAGEVDLPRAPRRGTTDVSEALRRLFSPIPLGHAVARNRIVSTPHGAAFGERGGITDRYIRYHEEKAKGGCGVVMMFGSSSIHRTSINDWGEVNNWDDGIVPQLRQMSDAIHRH